MFEGQTTTLQQEKLKKPICLTQSYFQTSTSNSAFIASFSSGENVTQDSQEQSHILKKRSGLGASSIGVEGSNDEVGDGVAVEDLDAPEDIDFPGFKTLYPIDEEKAIS